MAAVDSGSGSDSDESVLRVSIHYKEGVPNSGMNGQNVRVLRKWSSRE